MIIYENLLNLYNETDIRFINVIINIFNIN